MSERNKLQFLERILGKSKYSSTTKEAEFYCCFCMHHKPKLSVNLEYMVWKCWVCGKAGGNISFLIKSAGGSKQDIQEFVEKYGSKTERNCQKITENVAFKPKLPTNFEPIWPIKDTFFGRRAFRYLTEKRKISPEEILRHKIGITIDGEYKDSIIFPSFDKDGYLNYFTARFFNGFKRGPETPRGYKNQIVMNELNIDWKRPVVVTEGPVDLLKSIDNTVPLFGSTCSINSKLFRMIVSNETSVILALDADARKKTDWIAQNFMRYDVSVYIIDLGKYEDVGEMSKEEFVIAYENATLLQKDDIFRRKLRMLC